MTDQQKRTIDRRRFVQMGSIAGLGVAGVTLARVAMAQSDPSTPEASPAASPNATPGATPAASPASNTALTLKMVEFSFTPNKLTVPADTDITIDLVNDGILSHDFVIGDLDISSGLISPGEPKSITFKVPAGSYEFICSVEGHADAGMYGTITAE